jgi:hypothetical protein
MQAWQFFVAVKSHFGPLAAAAAFLVFHTYQHIRKRKGWPVKIPQWVLGMGAFLGVLTACFLAWSDERTARDNAESDIKELRASNKRFLEARLLGAPSAISHPSPDSTSSWRGLTELQVDRWATELTPLHIKSMRVNWANTSNGMALLDSMRKVGKIAGFAVDPGIGSADGKAILIVADKSDPTGPVLLRLFIAADFPAKLSPSDQPEPQIDILLGEKP